MKATSNFDPSGAEHGSVKKKGRAETFGYLFPEGS